LDDIMALDRAFFFVGLKQFANDRLGEGGSVGYSCRSVLTAFVYTRKEQFFGER
jgi:hypothetical protein